MIVHLQRFIHNKLFIILACGVLLQLLLMTLGFMGDAADFFAWADHILTHGSTIIYNTNFHEISRANANYPPFIIWLLSFSLFLTYMLKGILDAINVAFPFFPSSIVSGFDPLVYFVTIYKILFLLSANLGVALLTYIFVSRRDATSKSKKIESIALTAAGLIILNPALIYGTTMLGQVDIIPLFFILGSLYLLVYKKNVLMSSLLFVVALLFKQTVIIFFPLYFLAILKYFNWKSLCGSVALITIVTWAAFVPFVSHWNSVISPITTYLAKVQFATLNQVVTGSAWNLWFLIFGFKHVSDTQHILFGISYRDIGYLLFFSTLLFIGYFFWKRVDKDNKEQATSLFYAFSLCAFSSALFLTRLYERHFLQILPFLILLYTGQKNQFFRIVFLSLFILVNIFYYWNPAHAFFGTSLLLESCIRIAIVAVLFLYGILLYEFYLYSKKSA